MSSGKSELTAQYYYEPERVPGLVPSTSACIVDQAPPPFTNDSAASRFLIDDLPPTSSHGVLVGSQTNESEPPPEFSPYQADYFETGNGDVVSHDPHLNTDGIYKLSCVFRLLKLNDTPRRSLVSLLTRSSQRRTITPVALSGYTSGTSDTLDHRW